MKTMLRGLVGAAGPTIKHLGLVVALFFIATGNALAASVGTTFTDLWWNPAESGWGVTVDHQQDIMFLTFFVYKADRSPYWVTAVLNRSGGGGIRMPDTYTGDVYETQGPWYGGAFNASQVTERKVGTATFTASTMRAASLQYTIDGVPIAKSIERQTLRAIDFSGIYLGGTFYTLTGCKNSSQNGEIITDTGTVTITHTGSRINLTARGNLLTCAFDGAYSQYGSLGSAAGQFNCSDGTSGPFSLLAMQWTIMGMSAIVTGTSQYCSFNGGLGGITGTH